MKKYLLKIKKLISLLLLIYGLISLTNIFTPIVNARLLTSLTEYDISAAYKYCLCFLIISIVTVIFTKIGVKLLCIIEEKLLHDIRYDILERILSLKVKNFDNASSGEFLERIKNDPQDIFAVFSIVQYNIFNIITEIIILMYVFYLNITIGLVYLIGIICIYYYEKYAYNRIEKLQSKFKDKSDKNGTIITEIIRGIREIKLLGIKNKINKIASNSFDEQAKINMQINIEQNNVYNNSDIIKAIITFLIVFVGIFLIENGALTLTTFLIVFFYRTEIFSLIFSYTSLKEYFVKYKVAKGRIDEIFDDAKYPTESFGKTSLKNIRGEIEFKNVEFSYDDSNKVINNISFKINALEDIAIVGKTGSGKSTIFNLLTKSYDNYDGTIMIDGVDIKELSYSSLIQNISVISQNPYVFNMSIKENLKLINRNVTDKEMIEACKIARIHDTIEKLPNKYDTLLGEGGINLSGGQKQRLAIARALLKRSKILLFDEATSALDNVTQKEIQTAIKSISDDYTIITIAHRLSTIINSDKIFVIDNGKIIAKGTHKKLLNESNYYKELYESDSILDE